MTANPSSKIQVLLIEDDDDYARLFSKVISLVETNRYEVHHTATLQSAIKLLDNEPFDLILTDLCLPDSQGLHTFRIVQKHSASRPIVILTNIEDESTALAAIHEGAQDYVNKTQLNVPVLRRAVTYAMERQREQTHRENLVLLDELTGLYNRAGFVNIGNLWLTLVTRLKEPYTLFCINIVDLAGINKQRGYLEGDRIMQEIAGVLGRLCRRADIIARPKGDEFTVLALGVLPSQAREWVETFEREIEQQQALSGRNYELYTVYVNGGEAEIPAEELLRLTESASAGRNTPT